MRYVIKRLGRSFALYFFTKIVNYSISTTAGVVYLADSAQVPRVQAKYTADSAQVPRGVLELKLHEEESKYTEATAEVYLLSSECNFITS